MPLPRSTKFNEDIRQVVEIQGTLPVSIEGSVTVGPTTTVPYDIKIAENADGQAEYIGEAAPGTSTATAAWRVRHLTYSNGKFVSSTFLAGGAFNQVWDIYA